MHFKLKLSLVLALNFHLQFMLKCNKPRKKIIKKSNYNLHKILKIINKAKIFHRYLKFLILKFYQKIINNLKLALMRIIILLIGKIIRKVRINKQF